MTVSIDPNIKKTKLFIDKNGNRITEEQLFAGVGDNVGANPGTEGSQPEEEKSS